MRGRENSLRRGSRVESTSTPLGQRIKKSTPTATTHFVYDEAGHLIGEYDSAGTLIQETLWLGDTPVAVLKPNGSGGVNTFYLHTDHLNTPGKITRPSDNAIVWRWDADPFGTTAANQDPDGDGTAFAYSLRFPGQYADAETGLNYNYFRDYDPGTGRYVQSDPIGLFGGINTYSYAKSEPTMNVDPDGKNAVAAGLGVVYACAIVACSYSGIMKCHRTFPNHANPLSSDKAPYSKCTEAVLAACAMLNFAADPPGGVSGEIGGRIGKGLLAP